LIYYVIRFKGDSMGNKVHFIAMGGEHGCIPDNCQAYTSIENAVNGLDDIYELSLRQLKELQDSGSTELKRKQGGAYCSIYPCDCDSPWEHSLEAEPDNWEEYREEEE
jgi:hypothetical protein